MIVCPACGHHNAEGRTRCEICGASLEHFLYRVCPACGALNAADRTFCLRCLTNLLQAEEEDIAQGQAIAGGPTAPPPPAESAPPVEAPLPPAQAPSSSLPATWEETLSALSDLLPAGAAQALAGRKGAPPPPMPSEEERAEAALFQRVAKEGTTGRVPPISPAPSAVPDILAKGRVLFALLLIAAALVPLWFAPWGEGRLAPTSGARTWLEALGPHDAVLVVFAYSPAYAGELQPLAEAFLHTLAERSVRSIAIASQPAGVGLAKEAYRAVEEAVPAYAYGERYAILGYLPGQEAGLNALLRGLEQTFARDALLQRPTAELPALQGLSQVAAFQGILILSDEDTPVRQWVEQVHSRTGLPLIAGVAARAAPLLAPYQHAGQLRYLVAGPSGLIEMTPGQVDRRLVARANGLVIYFAIWCAVAVVSNILYWRERRREG